MASVQRLVEYTKLENEDQYNDRQRKMRNPGQEATGEVKFDNVQMRYRPSLPPALDQLSFVINPGMSVAVVGRTGAGKSSLYQLLLSFRSANQGKVTVDGNDTSQVEL